MREAIKKTSQAEAEAVPSSSSVEVEVKVGVEVGVEVGRCSIDGVKKLFRSGLDGWGWVGEDELKNKTNLSQS